MMMGVLARPKTFELEGAQFAADASNRLPVRRRHGRSNLIRGKRGNLERVGFGRNAPHTWLGTGGMGDCIVRTTAVCAGLYVRINGT